MARKTIAQMEAGMQDYIKLTLRVREEEYARGLREGQAHAERKAEREHDQLHAAARLCTLNVINQIMETQVRLAEAAARIAGELGCQH
jgi:hypothetical protein